MNLYRPVEATSPALLRFKSIRRGAPVPLSDSLPMLEHMGLRGARRASVRDRAGRRGAGVDRTTSACSRAATPMLDVEAVRGDHRGGARRACGRGDDRERRLQPPGARARRSPADEVVVLRAYAQVPAARPASPSARPTSSRRSPRIRAIAAMLVALFHARFDPATRRRRASDAAALAARSSRRSTRSRTSTRTASCAASSR